MCFLIILIQIILLKNVVIIPELFLGISIIYLLLFGSIVSTLKNYPLIQNLTVKLSALILFMSYVFLKFKLGKSVTCFS